jgi:molybdopterin/thiamine biosynthesis adenylyltransferase
VVKHLFQEATDFRMIKLIFPENKLSELAQKFRQEPLESFALILGRAVPVSPRGFRLLVQSIHVPAPDEYEMRSEVCARPTPAFRLAIEKPARKEGLSLIYCHSHSFQAGIPHFSEIDDDTEMPLAEYSHSRVPGVPHISLLIGAEGCRARELGCGPPVEVLEVGRRLIRHFPIEPTALKPEHNRQILAFGEEGQRAIQALRVAIVGLSGTGSVVAQQLAHLGVLRYLLIDPENMEDVNLNRVVGAINSDIGRPKVAIARRMIKRVLKGAEIKAVQGDILDAPIGAMLTGADFIFGCTDTHGSRHFLNRLAYQYFIPCIDMGTVIVPGNGGEVIYFGGRVQMLAPGLRCLVCGDDTLDPDEVRRDLLNEHQRRRDPYFQERTGIKQPAVISLNSAAASHAVTMFLAAVAGVPMNVRLQALRGIPGVVRPWDDRPRPNCVNCSEDAYFGKGTKHPLPAHEK